MGEIGGYPLMRATGLNSAKLYASLAELENAGFVDSRWIDPRNGYPRTRVYRLAGAPKFDNI